MFPFVCLLGDILVSSLENFEIFSLLIVNVILRKFGCCCVLGFCAYSGARCILTFTPSEIVAVRRMDYHSAVGHVEKRNIIKFTHSLNLHTL